MLGLIFPFKSFRKNEKPLNALEVFAKVITAPKDSDIKKHPRHEEDKKQRPTSVQAKHDVMSARPEANNDGSSKKKRSASQKGQKKANENEASRPKSAPGTITRALKSVRGTIKSRRRARCSDASSGYMQNWLDTPWDERANAYPTPSSGNTYTFDEYEERGSWISTLDSFVCNVPECPFHARKGFVYRPHSQSTAASVSGPTGHGPIDVSRLCTMDLRRGTECEAQSVANCSPVKYRAPDALREVSNTASDRKSAQIVKPGDIQGQVTEVKAHGQSGKLSGERVAQMSRDEALDFYTRARRFI